MRPNALRAHHTILHAHGEIASTLCLPALAIRPSVVTFNGLHLLRRLDGARRAAAEANLRLIVRAASKTICVSQAEHDELADVVSPRLMRKAVLIHNGVAPRALPTPADGPQFAPSSRSTRRPSSASSSDRSTSTRIRSLPCGPPVDVSRSR